MRKATVTVSYDEKKLDALRKYLEKKGIDFENEMVKSIDALYNKNVPSAVKEYLDMKSEPSNHLYITNTDCVLWKEPWRKTAAVLNWR